MVTSKAILVDEHIERLNESLAQFQIPIQMTTECVDELIKRHGLRDVALKILVTRDNVIATTRPVCYSDDYYESGSRLCISPIMRSSRSYLTGHKSTNYGDMILSLRKAQEDGYNDCLFFNENGYVTETAIANLFIIKDDKVMTPKGGMGLLAGIIRQYIMERYPVMETKIVIDDIVFADAVFLTNSLVGIVKVKSIDFDPVIIRQNRLFQVAETIPETVTYKDHPIIELMRKEYKQFIENKEEGEA